MMTKMKISLIAFLALVVFIAIPALACHISFEPSDAKVDENGIAEVVAVLKWEHRRCVLEEDDIKVDYKGVEKISESGWKKEKKGLYKNTIKVKLTAEEGSIRVWRECSKKGISEATVKIHK